MEQFLTYLKSYRSNGATNDIFIQITEAMINAFDKMWDNRWNKR